MATPRYKPVCAGVVMKNHRGEYLLVFGRYAKKWGFPKGHLEEKEDWKVCAQRETYEETGLKVNIPERTRYCFTKKSIYYLIGTDCVVGNLYLNPKDKKEVVTVRWMNRKTLLSLTRDEVNHDVWGFIGALKWMHN